MRFLRPDTIREFYRGILKRNPTGSEVSNFALDFARNPDLEARLRAMIYSPEFAIMVMPDLVRAATENFTGRNVFFLHVPKTAGTSVRLGLMEALGVPSLNLYPLTSQSTPERFETMEFWPYWAGHANISAFPASHVGFTSLRESRSRLLSQFRQKQLNITPGANPHVISDVQRQGFERRSRSEDNADFNRYAIKSARSIVHWYISNPSIERNLKVAKDGSNYNNKLGSGSAWHKIVNAMSDAEVAKELQKSILRFSSAGWLHQPEGLINAMVKATGNPNASLPRENEFKKSPNYQVETISPESLEILEGIRKRDAIFFKIATDAGVLVDPLREDEDEIFHKSLEKLGYKLS